MSEILIRNIGEIEERHHVGAGEYEFVKKSFLGFGMAKGCVAAVYSVPPRKTAYPYHFHTQCEEVFFIISGSGILKTPLGEKKVSAGDFIYFPANENGAHKLTNDSDSETLTYLDFDTHGEIDVALYPDSNKIGIWGKNINKAFKAGENVDYYDGE